MPSAFLWLGYPSVVPLVLFVLAVAAGPIFDDLRLALARLRRVADVGGPTA